MLRRSVQTGKRCLLATPNVNFVAEAIRDSGFRDFLLRADMATADGMPLVWLARLMGLPIRERASGADIFDTLRERVPGQGSMPVFFFGGRNDTARRAHAAVNATDDNLISVGAISPGFGSVEELSQQQFIDTINQSMAGMLVLALGAVKGHTWIQANADRLTTPVLCHLGAVVAFASDDVKRAPRWMRSAGFEWAWRIGQEPTLVRRYLRDAMHLAPFLLSRTLPYIAWHRVRRIMARTHQPQRIDAALKGNTVELRLTGDFTLDRLDALRRHFSEASTDRLGIRLILDGVTFADPAFVGLLILLRGWCDANEKPLSVVCNSRRIRRILRFNCAEYLIDAGT